MSDHDAFWPGRLRWGVWLRLATRSGRTARVSAMLTGLPEFARLVLEKVRAAAIDAETRPMLEATVAGHPPSVWP